MHDTVSVQFGNDIIQAQEKRRREGIPVFFVLHAISLEICREDMDMQLSHGGKAVEAEDKSHVGYTSLLNPQTSGRFQRLYERKVFGSKGCDGFQFRVSKNGYSNEDGRWVRASRGPKKWWVDLG